MGEDKVLEIKVGVPLDYHLPFPDVVNQMPSQGLAVKGTYPDVRSIHGSGTQDVLQRLNQMGLKASEVQRVSWKV
jgi:hypothetical protein